MTGAEMVADADAMRGEVNFNRIEYASAVASPVFRWRQPARHLELPLRPMDKPDITGFFDLISDFRGQVPAIELSIGHLSNALVVIEPSCDGIVITADGAAVLNTLLYTSKMHHLGHSGGGLISGCIQDEVIDAGFVSFDAAWQNYYHWSVFGLGRAGIAHSALPLHVDILVPDAHALRNTHPTKYGADVSSAISFMTPHGRHIRKLRNGIHRVRDLYIMYVDNFQQTHMTSLPLFREPFRQAAKESNRRNGLSSRPRRIYISRNTAADHRRVSDAQEEGLRSSLIKMDFEFVRPETLSYPEQMEVFSSADIVVGAHGSGLVNMLYAKEDAKLLEVISPLDVGPTLRPWFYMLSASHGQKYGYLRIDQDEITRDYLRSMIRAL